MIPPSIAFTITPQGHPTLIAWRGNNNKFNPRLQSDVSSYYRLLPPFYLQIIMTELVPAYSLYNCGTDISGFLRLNK